MDITEEQLKDMSPEEILELQKKNCIFCQIISGGIPSRKIYEDEEVLAILDINPANPGHTLVIPKAHYQIMPQLPDKLIGKIFILAKSLSQSTLRGLGSEGNTIFVANGVAAGQKAPHFMVHIIPRVKEDFLELSIPEKTSKESELVNIKSALQARLKSLQAASMPAAGKPQIEALAKEKKPKEQIKIKEKEKKSPARKKQAKEKTEYKRKSADLDKLTELLGGGGKNGQG